MDQFANEYCFELMYLVRMSLSDLGLDFIGVFKNPGQVVLVAG